MFKIRSYNLTLISLLFADGIQFLFSGKVVEEEVGLPLIMLLICYSILVLS